MEVTMLIACPSCAAKNNLPDSPDPKKVYRCGKCKSKLFNFDSKDPTETQNFIKTDAESQTVEHFQVSSDDDFTTETESTALPTSEIQQESDESSLIDIWLSSDEVALIVTVLLNVLLLLPTILKVTLLVPLDNPLILVAVKFATPSVIVTVPL